MEFTTAHHKALLWKITDPLPSAASPIFTIFLIFIKTSTNLNNRKNFLKSCSLPKLIHTIYLSRPHYLHFGFLLCLYLLLTLYLTNNWTLVEKLLLFLLLRTDCSEIFLSNSNLSLLIYVNDFLILLLILFLLDPSCF